MGAYFSTSICLSGTAVLTIDSSIGTAQEGSHSGGVMFSSLRRLSIALAHTSVSDAKSS